MVSIAKRGMLLLFAALLPFLMKGFSTPTITITPGYLNIGLNATVQYQASVTGLTNTAVTWQVSNLPGGNSTNGTITTSGLYTAPAKIPANSTTVSALGSDGKTLGIVYVNIEPVGPAITAASPNPVPTGNQTVTLTGSGFQSGALIMGNGAVLSTTFVNSNTLKVGVYDGAAGTLSLQVENPGTLWGPVFKVPIVNNTLAPQSIAPTSVSVKLGTTQQLTSSGATSWTATAGTISSAGLYTAPSSMPSSPAVTVTATGPGGSASAIVTLLSGTLQIISPTSVSLNLAASQQFTSVGATAWTAKYGAVTSAGKYTAPSTAPASWSDTVTATGPNGSASATVSLIPPAPVITAVSNNGQLPLGIFSATVTGTGFISGSVAKLNGVALPTTYSSGALKIAGFSGAATSASLTVTNGSLVSPAFPVEVGVQNPQVSPAAARRFLEEAAFGPTPQDAANVQTLGFQPWLNQQFALGQVSSYTSTSDQGGLPAHFLTMAVSNSDQLRQRVAFALSQIFVTSLNTLIWNANMVLFQNMLLSDAFSNYRQIMGDVTLSPAMGQYLNMVNNAKADPTQGTVANENYARELMQLFTIGTNALNQDGSPQLDSSSLPVPNYSQFTVTEFARVFTGWTYAPAPGAVTQWNAYITSNGPMVPYEMEHDEGSKQLLKGYVETAGLTAQEDLSNALDNIFNHPNVGPFVGKQLIQHLVKSNPSPSYISRVAGIFNNNGQGVRGDMKAVISAVLLDPEARANDNGGNDQPTDGHLQEPALFIAGMVRAFGGQMTDENYYSTDLANLGQDLFSAPSVFNYYAPNYGVPGTSLQGGEFQIHTPNTAILRANEVLNLFFSSWEGPVETYGPGTKVDLTPFVPLAATPATLVNALDLTLTHGVMPAGMKSAIVSAVTADAANGAADQVQTACYLILTSDYYNVWH